MVAAHAAVTHGRTFFGRALIVAADGSLYIGRGRRIYRSADLGETWRLDARVPGITLGAAFSWSRLARRALRHEITDLAILPDGTRVAIARAGIFRAAAAETIMAPVFRFSGDLHALNLCATPAGDVLFGQYGRNPARREVSIYASRDRGQRFEPVWNFPPGAVRHIHNVIHDPYLDAFWVFSGDYGEEPGIALLSRDFRHMDWVARGDQQVRAVSALVERDCLIYGTDTEIEQNHILRFDKKTGRREILALTSGSALCAARFGPYSAVSTAVEPSKVNLDRMARLYLSTDGHSWKEAASYEKDVWHPALQYGNVVLARSSCRDPIALFSGQAVRGFDDRCRVVRLDRRASTQ